MKNKELNTLLENLLEDTRVIGNLLEKVKMNIRRIYAHHPGDFLRENEVEKENANL
jgi:hypothetical protein